ncbi:hypothetical protein Q4595_19910, partial [Wenyingzhuangia sp. 1_MG-2023]|nr:hypothetical protein [Wenyingzhuangia sp. 1_MG-2023]
GEIGKTTANNHHDVTVCAVIVPDMMNSYSLAIWADQAKNKKCCQYRIIRADIIMAATKNPT